MSSHKNWVSGLLKDNPQGLTIQDISSRLKLHRQTVKNVLAELKGEGVIKERVVGQAKLHYWNFGVKKDGV